MDKEKQEMLELEESRSFISINYLQEQGSKKKVGDVHAITDWNPNSSKDKKLYPLFQNDKQTAKNTNSFQSKPATYNSKIAKQASVDLEGVPCVPNLKLKLKSPLTSDNIEMKQDGVKNLSQRLSSRKTSSHPRLSAKREPLLRGLNRMQQTDNHYHVSNHHGNTNSMDIINSQKSNSSQPKLFQKDRVSSISLNRTSFLNNLGELKDEFAENETYLDSSGYMNNNNNSKQYLTQITSSK